MGSPAPRQLSLPVPGAVEPRQPGEADTGPLVRDVICSQPPLLPGWASELVLIISKHLRALVTDSK